MLDPGTKLPGNQVHSGDSYSSHGILNYGVLSRKRADDHGNYQGWNSMGVFGAQRKDVQAEESGVCSPPLWRTSPPRSPRQLRNHYRNLSPSSRTQAIARGQKELMEMVSRMPEGCYELSLKDIVEQPMAVTDVKEGSLSEDRSIINQRDMHILRREREKKTMKKRFEKKVQTKRSGSTINEGFLLKMVFPISFGSRKKKQNNSGNPPIINSSFKDGRVSPRPLLYDNGSEKSVDEEWWNNKFPESRDSESGTGLSSSNSGSSKSSGSSSRSSSRNSTRNGRGGCWSFIFAKKGKAAE
ncbi:hypothetical protein OIU84_005608 [Salix udensis]|uniref:Uncharacterized protein n=1 Tax=Salix udensis TaxID=889485 RepID=A0AAD6JYR3_9ROSI|nr:hypothetical protein OIU84_005608 [Salix udensis]